MKIKLLNKEVKIPEVKRQGDAAYDIYLPKLTEIKPHSITIIDTQIAVEIPEGYAGMMVIRSSIANRCGFVIQNALIDSNYRGPLHIMVLNNSDKKYDFAKNDRICSLVIFKVITPNLEIVEELSDTNRGKQWNGSTGE